MLWLQCCWVLVVLVLLLLGAAGALAVARYFLGWRTLLLNQTEQLSCNKSASSNFIASTDEHMIWTGDGCCSCQNLRTVSFPEACKVFWVQPIDLCCGVAVTASRCQRKLLVRPVSQNGFHNAERCPCCHVARRSLQCTGQRRSQSQSQK